MKKKHSLYIVGGRPKVGKGEIAKKMKELGLVGSTFSTDDVRINGNEELAWQNAIDYIENNQFDSDVLIEGVAITPEKIHELRLNNLVIKKVIFIGYGNESFFDVIMAHSLKVNRAGGNDYFYPEEMRRKSTGAPSQKDSMLRESEDLKQQAEKYGYKYYGVTGQPTTEGHTQIFIDRLLGDRDS